MKVPRLLFLLFLWLACPQVSWGQASPFVHHTEIGLLMGRENGNNRANFSFQTFNGVHFNSHHEMGFVIGLDHYNPLTLVPFGMGWRGILTPQNSFSFYTAIDIGYNSTMLEKKAVHDWNVHEWYEGGLMYHPAVGFRVKNKNSTQWTFSIGYKRQIANYYMGSPINDPWGDSPDPGNPNDWSYLQRDKIIFNNVVYKIGLLF
ncbi:hypothetical protein [Negadavirga shengliensis]|uniref:Outer membrane protein beta-barrel domain-containing protein n=1 Tax=Negadavirga shengliensis TaxID=1389218 RepID=A0ABV9T3K2_9BACT